MVQNQPVDISIFGLGYVGAVTAGCLAERGHRILGVDAQDAKVAAFRAGRSPIVEPELDGLLNAARRENRLDATTDVARAVTGTEVSLVCVGTPSLASGRLNLDYVRKVTQQIRDALREREGPHTLMYRSTMLPGSTRQVVEEFLSGLVAAKKVVLSAGSYFGADE